MLINFTNHTYVKWSDDQYAAAMEQFGRVVDIPFPIVPEDAGEADIARMADDAVRVIRLAGVSGEMLSVLVQGEFTLAFAIISRLQREGAQCYAACSKRETVETQAADGSTVKNAVFRFVRFRKYGAF
jgi:hypothetical protein